MRECSFSENRLHRHEERNPHSGMKQVEQEVLSVDIIDVALVGIGPSRWPGIRDHEPVATELKSWLTFDDNRLPDHNRVLPPKVLAEFVVRDMATLACIFVRMRLITVFFRFGLVLPIVFLRRFFLFLAFRFWFWLNLLGWLVFVLRVHCRRDTQR